MGATPDAHPAPGGGPHGGPHPYFRSLRAREAAFSLGPFGVQRENSENWALARGIGGVHGGVAEFRHRLHLFGCCEPFSLRPGLLVEAMGQFGYWVGYEGFAST